MKQVKHYVTTRFNMGLYNPKAKRGLPPIRVSPDEWMAHRMELFMTFALPSIMAQTCQNFTWTVVADDQTPAAYKDVLEGIRYPNIRFVYTDTGVTKAFRRSIAPGDYTLITTRIDNDDAFHKDTVKDIQDLYTQKSEMPRPWFIAMPRGYTLDLAAKRLYIMECPYSPFLTLVENASEPLSVWTWPHTKLPIQIRKEVIIPKMYWLMIVHSQNATNNMKTTSNKKIHYEMPLNLAVLADFGIDVGKLTGCESANRSLV